MYRILLKHSNNVKSNIWESYGNYSTATGSKESVFTEFETDDVDVLEAEITKIISERGNSEIRIVKDVEITYGVDVIEEEMPTDPDDTTGDDTGDGDGEDTTEH